MKIVLSFILQAFSLILSFSFSRCDHEEEQEDEDEMLITKRKATYDKTPVKKRRLGFLFCDVLLCMF